MLQDTILDTAPDENPVDKNNNIHLINTLDYGINFFLVVVAAILGLSAIFEASTLFILAFCNFFLGVYQLISAIVGSLRGNEHKRNYLITAIVYLMLLWLGIATLEGYVPSDFEPVLLIFFIIILPLGGATYFTFLCYEAKSSRS